MLYLYGVTDDPGVRLSAPLGFGDEPPDILDVGGLGAVAGAIAGPAPVGDGASVRRHLEVLEALMERCTVLPVRFGSVYSGREELGRHVSDARDALAADLERVRGHVEIGVRAIRAQASDPAQERKCSPTLDGERSTELGPGASYLVMKRAEAERSARQKQAVETLAGIVVGRLAPLASCCSWKAMAPAPGRPGISSAFLVRRESVDAFRAALAELSRAAPGVEFLCTGPWPPYSFVRGS